MAAYPQDGARPDALALDAAYKAVRVSWDEAFAGDPQQVAGRFTTWAQAGAALARNLTAEQHRAPKFRQALDTFISSATRLASRTQATAQDPAAWARVFADVPGNAPASNPGPDPAASADPAPRTAAQAGPDPQPDSTASGPATTAGAAEAAGPAAPAPADVPDKRPAPAPPDGTRPLAAHTGWAGNLRPERLLYADGTPLSIRGQGDDNDQARPATAAGAVPAPGGSEYGSGRLQVVRWDDGQHAIIHPALASPASIDAYAGLSGRDRARWEAFDLAEAWPVTTAGLPPTWSTPATSSRSSAGRAAAPWTCAKSSRSGPARAPPPAGSNSRSPASDPSCSTRRTRASRCASPMNTRRCQPPSTPPWQPPLIPREPQIPLRTCLPVRGGRRHGHAGHGTGNAPARTGSTACTGRFRRAGTRSVPAEQQRPRRRAAPPAGLRAVAHPDRTARRSRHGLPGPAEGPSLICDARGIEITVSGPDFTRHGLVTWPQAASWIDNGVTPARLGLVIIADRLSTFCRDHRGQLIAAGTCDPDAAAAELAEIRDNAVAMIVDAALHSRGSAAPVPPAGPDDPAWHTAVPVTRPDRAAGKAENAALGRLTQLRTMIREPQPATPAEIRAAIRRRTGYMLPDLVRALDNPAAMRAWISGQASRPVPDSHDASGEHWYGASADGLVTDRRGDDRAPALIRWEEIPAWIQPGITSSLRDRLLAADDASSAVFGRLFTAAARPQAGLTAPSEDEDQQATQRRTEAVDTVWAAIEAAPPPTPAQLDHARHVYRDTSPVQQTLFDDPPQDSTQDGTRATASRPPRPASSGRGAPDGAGRAVATAAAPQAEPAGEQTPPGHLAAGPGPPQPLNPPLPPRSTSRTRITPTRAPAQKKTSPPRRPAQPQHPPAIPRPRPVPRTPACARR